GVKTIVGDFTSTQSEPAVSGTNVVYVDDAEKSIRLLDGISLNEITLYAGPALAPAIDGNYVAWADLSGADPDIVVRDLTTGGDTRLTLPGAQLNPKISGEFVAFEDQSSGLSHIGLWHWPGGELLYVGPTGSRQNLHGISGNRV